MIRRGSVLLTALVMPATVLLLTCSETGSSSGGSDNNQDPQLSTFTTPGNQVELPTGGTEKINGLVVDSDGDGSGDGLDIDGNSTTLEVFYVLDVKTGAARATSEVLPFRLAGSDTVYYLVLSDEEEVTISTNEDGSEAIVTFLLSDTNAIEGIDIDGNGTVDEEVLTDIIAEIVEETVTCPDPVGIGTEGFEGSFLPAGWTQSALGTGATEWVQGEDSGSSYPSYSGTYMAEFYTSQAEETYLISPQLSIPEASDAPTFSLWSWIDYQVSASLDVYVSEGSNVPAAGGGDFQLLGNVPASGDMIYEQATFDLSGYACKAVYIAVRVSSSGDSYQRFIDDLQTNF